MRNYIKMFPFSVHAGVVLTDFFGINQLTITVRTIRTKLKINSSQGLTNIQFSSKVQSNQITKNNSDWELTF